MMLPRTENHSVTNNVNGSAINTHTHTQCLLVKSTLLIQRDNRSLQMKQKETDERMKRASIIV